MSDAALTDYRVGDWRVRVDRHELERGGELRRLQPRLVALLGCLAAAAGRTVTREELLARVWQRQMVNDEVLSRAIADLRRALDDDARQASMIETVPKLGYRLCVPVELVAEEAAFINSGDPGSDATAESSAPAAFIKSSASRRVVVVAALAAAVAVLVATWWSGVRVPRPDTTSPGLSAADLVHARPLAGASERNLMPRFSRQGGTLCLQCRHQRGRGRGHPCALPRWPA